MFIHSFSAFIRIQRHAMYVRGDQALTILVSGNIVFRLFDSQNNRRGGYNVGSEDMHYFAGSKLQIEW